MPEEEAFSLFVTLMNKYGLRDLFVADMAGLHLHLYQFERLLEEFEPALYCHLRRREVNSTPPNGSLHCSHIGSRYNSSCVFMISYSARVLNLRS